MRRGDLITVAVSGDYGKPRPAVVVQSDRLQGTDSVIVCQLTSTLRDASSFRVTIEPSSQTGLRTTSQIMVDKMIAVHRSRCGGVIGRLEPTSQANLDSCLALVLGLAD